LKRVSGIGLRACRTCITLSCGKVRKRSPFDGRTVLAGGASLSGLGRTNVSGGSKSLVLTLPSLPSGKLPGNYQDVITLTLSAGN